MLAYLVIQLRSGDMIAMRRMFSNRPAAFAYLAEQRDTETSWWKVVELDSTDIQFGLPVDIVLRVRWETSNRVTFIGAYQPGFIPPQYSSDHYFAETLTLSN